MDLYYLRNSVFKAAREYHEALADYFHAMKQGADIEAPTQQLVGKAVFYQLALVKLPEQDVKEHRLEYLADTQASATERYHLLKVRLARLAVKPGQDAQVLNYAAAER